MLPPSLQQTIQRASPVPQHPQRNPSLAPATMQAVTARAVVEQRAVWPRHRGDGCARTPWPVRTLYLGSGSRAAAGTSRRRPH